MLCVEFEDQLTDYLEGSLDGGTQRACAEHALRCPICHDLLSEVKNTLQACRNSTPPPPSASLEARVLMQTTPETAMACEDFESHLTDYLDGFLPAPLYHRWERHAALCGRCTNLPGEVVRSIGACYSYISEDLPAPAGLHERILQATLGTTQAAQVRAPLTARLAAVVRAWLDVIVTPQLATVATMVLVAVLVGTSTLSDDGSIGGMYRAIAQSAGRGNALSDNLKRVAGNLVGDPAGGENKEARPASQSRGGEKQPE